MRDHLRIARRPGHAGRDAEVDRPASSEPTLIGSSYVFQTGKDHNAYLINAGPPGGVTAPAAELNGFCAGESFGGSIYLASTATIYAACSSGLKALSLGASGGTPTLASKQGFTAPSGLTLNRGARLTVTLVRRVRRPGRPVLSRALRLRTGHWRVHLRL